MINLINNNIYNIVYLFTIYSFGGWCLEVSYYFKKEKRFVNRGFLKGPFCPIYGFCIVNLILLLSQYKNNIPLLFLCAFFITSILEYTTGLILEKMFKTKWWDYSDNSLNIHGRVCLSYSLLWATSEVIIITIINPIIVNVIYNMSYIFSSTFFYCIIFYFLLDFLITLSSLCDLNKFSSPFELALGNFSIGKANSISNLYKDKALDKFRSFELIFQKLRLNNKRLIRNFNNKSYPQFNEIIKNIRKKIKKY